MYHEQFPVFAGPQTGFPHVSISAKDRRMFPKFWVCSTCPASIVPWHAQAGFDYVQELQKAVIDTWDESRLREKIFCNVCRRLYLWAPGLKLLNEIQVEICTVGDLGPDPNTMDLDIDQDPHAIIKDIILFKQALDRCLERYEGIQHSRPGRQHHTAASTLR